MEFSLGQNVWVMTAWDPTINWEEGVIAKKFNATTYNIALWDGTLLTGFKSTETGYGDESFRTILPYFLNLRSDPYV